MQHVSALKNCHQPQKYIIEKGCNFVCRCFDICQISKFKSLCKVVALKYIYIYMYMYKVKVYVYI